MKAKPITIRPSAELRARLDALAAQDERSLTWIVTKCLEAHLSSLEARYAITTSPALIHDAPTPTPKPPGKRRAV